MKRASALPLRSAAPRRWLAGSISRPSTNRRRRHVTPPGIQGVRHRSVAPVGRNALAGPGAGLCRSSYRTGAGAGARRDFRLASSPPSMVSPAATVEVEGVAGHAGTAADANAQGGASGSRGDAARHRGAGGAFASIWLRRSARSKCLDLAANTIPGRVALYPRYPQPPPIRSGAMRSATSTKLSLRIAHRRGVTAELAVGHEVPAPRFRRCRPLSDQLAKVVEAMGIKPRRLPSGRRPRCHGVRP